MCVRVCVCARARARVRVCVFVRRLVYQPDIDGCFDCDRQAVDVERMRQRLNGGRRGGGSPRRCVLQRVDTQCCVATLDFHGISATVSGWYVLRRTLRGARGRVARCTHVGYCVLHVE